MARLQILELPEGADDTRPPFILVIDQALPERHVLVSGEVRVRSEWDTLADAIGARGIIVTPETIDIPANDTSAYAASLHKAQWTDADKIQARATEGMRLAHERVDIARDMDRLAKRKNELLDALGMDNIRDWDDIRNAAARIKRSRDGMRDAIQRVRDLPENPEIMNAHQPHPEVYLHGYRIAIREAKRATRDPELAHG